jgi:pyrroloquinoline quinone biosynthesis protein E
LSTPTPNPLLLIAELSYRCPLHCPYCSNPLEIGHARYSDELETKDWARVFREASALGVLQLALTGGEPLVRKDVEELARVSAESGLYSTLVTAGTPFTPTRARALRDAGLDHVQISIQDSDPLESDRIAGTASFGKKIAAARLARELDFPLTINVVLHRQNLDRIEAIIALAEELGARRLELANTQYQGWAVINRSALMPTRAQLEVGEQAVARARERLGPRMEILWVLPDYYEEFPKPCMGGWGRDAMVITPNGDVLPCQAAATIPGLEFDNVRDRPLEEIWFDSAAFQKFRGTEWMPEPCRSCPFDRQEVDFGGCRCQALALTGDASNTDPVCHISPHHSIVVEAREAAQSGDGGALVYRTTRPPVVRH